MNPSSSSFLVRLLLHQGVRLLLHQEVGAVWALMTHAMVGVLSQASAYVLPTRVPLYGCSRGGWPYLMLQCTSLVFALYYLHPGSPESDQGCNKQASKQKKT